jgi:hypothetical protein
MGGISPRSLPHSISITKAGIVTVHIITIIKYYEASRGSYLDIYHVVLDRLLEDNALAKNLLARTVQFGSQFPKLSWHRRIIVSDYGILVYRASPLSLPSGIQSCIEGE